MLLGVGRGEKETTDMSAPSRALQTSLRAGIILLVMAYGNDVREAVNHAPNSAVKGLSGLSKTGSPKDATQETRDLMAKAEAAVDGLLVNTCDARVLAGVATYLSSTETEIVQASRLHQIAEEQPQLRPHMTILAKVVCNEPGFFPDIMDMLKAKLDALPWTDPRRYVTGLLPSRETDSLPHSDYIRMVSTEFLTMQDTSEKVRQARKLKTVQGATRVLTGTR